MRLARRPGEEVSSRAVFPNVEIPDEVLSRARDLPDFEAVEVVEEFLREIHGPMPDHRDDRDRWLLWVEAVEERALGMIEAGSLA